MKQSTLIILVFTILCNVLSAQSEVTLRSDFFDNIDRQQSGYHPI